MSSLVITPDRAETARFKKQPCLPKLHYRLTKRYQHRVAIRSKRWQIFWAFQRKNCKALMYTRLSDDKIDLCRCFGRYASSAMKN